MLICLLVVELVNESRSVFFCSSPLLGLYTFCDFHFFCSFSVYYSRTSRGLIAGFSYIYMRVCFSPSFSQSFFLAGFFHRKQNKTDTRRKCKSILCICLLPADIHQLSSSLPFDPIRLCLLIKRRIKKLFSPLPHAASIPYLIRFLPFSVFLSCSSLMLRAALFRVVCNS